MGWETINGRRYFYENVCVDGVRTRTCHGYSVDAMLAADRVEKEKQARAADIALVRSYQLRDQQIDRKAADLATFINHVLRQQLVPHGFHWTNGRWRKRRSNHKPIMSENSQTNDVSASSREHLANRGLLQLSPFKEQSNFQIEESDQAAELLGDDVRRLTLECLRDLEAKKPNSNEDRPRVQLTCRIEQTVDDVKTKVAQLRQELQYEDANIFDRLIIEQLLSAWVQVFVASWLLDGELPSNRTWRENQYFERRYQLCHTRLAKAIDQLSKIRQIDVSCLTIETKAERDAEAESIRKWKAHRIVRQQVEEMDEEDDDES